MTEQSGVRKWLGENSVAAFSIAGALVYGVTRMAYVGFYGEFGLDPEDVGVGYAATLARALPGVFVWMAVWTLLVMAVLVAMVFLLDRRLDRHRLRRLAPVMAAIGAWSFAALLVLMPFDAQRAARGVKRGDELRAPSGLVSWGILRDPLGFTVREITIDWLDDATRGRTQVGRPLMLLGTDGDVYYVYDVQHRRTIRLPRSLVVVGESIG